MVEIKIFQTEDPSLMFKRYDCIAEQGVDLDKYDLVWHEVLLEGRELGLDDIFERFNIDLPRGYAGRSLSVSDIIELNDEKWYVDSFGFKRL